MFCPRFLHKHDHAKIFLVDLLLPVHGFLGSKVRENSYCAPDYPVISQNTSLHFNRLGPFTSPWEVWGGSTFCGSLQLWRNPRSYQHAVASNNGKHTCL